jgi:copper chaperone
MKLSIPDMSCGHCEASVKAALMPLAGAVQVDLPARMAQIEGQAQPEAVIAALSAIGFAAQVVAE